MERGEVRWYQFSPPDKERPVVILTNTPAIRYLNTVTIAPISTSIRPVPSQVRLTIEEGMFEDCSINLHSIQTVLKRDMGRYITSLSPERMRQVEQAIQFALGIGKE